MTFEIIPKVGREGGAFWVVKLVMSPERECMAWHIRGTVQSPEWWECSDPWGCWEGRQGKAIPRV